MYLGRVFSFQQTHDRELRNRINKAWAVLANDRNELIDCHYDLEKRVQLFELFIQPTLLGGCCCWTMTRKREATVRTVQRKVMRNIVGMRRLAHEDGLEDWAG